VFTSVITKRTSSNNSPVFFVEILNIRTDMEDGPKPFIFLPPRILVKQIYPDSNSFSLYLAETSCTERISRNGKIILNKVFMAILKYKIIPEKCKKKARQKSNAW